MARREIVAEDSPECVIFRRLMSDKNVEYLQPLICYSKIKSNLSGGLIKIHWTICQRVHITGRFTNNTQISVSRTTGRVRLRVTVTNEHTMLNHLNLPLLTCDIRIQTLELVHAAMIKYEYIVTLLLFVL